MIAHTATEPTVKVTGVEDAMGFMLDPAATAHILNMLRSGVYKDPKMACIREYWCNARDSVVEAGKDPSKHVFITLPNDYEPYFKIRDEGMGLSEADFRRVFRKYGASTKRDSNEQIGCLGIGSKSAFSYSDTFTVTAIKSGMKRVFIASVARNSVASDGIGNLNLVQEVDTTEANGVEVSIPVKETDFDDFRSKTLHFMSFLPASQRPIVRGINQSLVDVPVRTGEYRGLNWTLTQEGNSYAIMGGVPYALDSRSMDGLSDEAKSLVDFGVDMVFDIGEVEMAISREELRYTEFSLAALKNRLEGILSFLSDEISKKIVSPKSIWDAKWIYRSIYQAYTVDAKLIREVLGKSQKFTPLMWNGKLVTNNAFEAAKGVVMYTCRLDGDDKISRSACKSFAVTQENQFPIIIHDAKRYGEWQRVQTYLKQQKAVGGFVQCLVIRYEFSSAKDAMQAEYDINSLQVNLLSSFERDRTNSAIARKTARSFEFNPVDSPFQSGEDYWDAQEADLDAGGLYVEVNRNWTATSRYHSFSCSKIKEALKVLSDINVAVDVVWGFKPSIVAKLDHTKWKPFKSFIVENVKKHLIDNKVGQHPFDSNVFSSLVHSDEVPRIMGYVATCEKEIIPYIKPDSIFVKYVKDLAAFKEKYKENPLSVLLDFYKQYNQYTHDVLEGNLVESQDLVDFKVFAKQVGNKYPMLTICESFRSCSAAKIANYINEKDA